MGLIKAIKDAVGGEFAEQWLEAIEPSDMGDKTVFTKGTLVRQGSERNHNRKGFSDVVNDGSIIHVYENQFMMLIDGGKIVDYTAEPGYYKVSNSSSPSMFNGDFLDTLKDAFDRIKFAGITPKAQKAYYINLQEIKGIKFGTRNAINYFDNFYNAELFLRAFGTYSMKIVNPIQFYSEAIPKNADHVEIEDINEQYLSEFLEALQASINEMSVDGVRISHVVSKTRELSKYMAETLDEDWKAMRGMEIQSVAIASISYNEESEKLINMRNQGAMLGDPRVREGYVQGSVARGMEAAGSNANGSMAGFMGMGVGLNAGGGFMGAASQANAQQMKADSEMYAAMQKQNTAENKPAEEGWTCSCGKTGNTGKFCPECGKKKPAEAMKCAKCGYEVPEGETPKFCPECGNKF